MAIAKDQLNQYEEWLSKGKTSDVLEDLFSKREKTVYHKEIILLSNKIRSLNKEKISGSISTEDQLVEQGKVNNALISLIQFLKEETSGGLKSEISGLDEIKVNTQNNSNQSAFSFHRLFPFLFTALVSAGAATFYMHSTMKFNEAYTCNDNGLNLAGAWHVKWASPHKGQGFLFGKAKVYQDSCFKNFDLSCQFELNEAGTDFLTFNSKIGGYNGDEVYLIYENSLGEKGICNGELLSDYKQGFHMKCVDLIIGADTLNGKTGVLTFRKTPFQK